MSVSSRLVALIRGAPTLWITSRRRALGAAIAAIIVLAPAIALEVSEPWRLMASVQPRRDAPRDTEVVSALAWSRAADIDVVLLLGGSTAREFTGSDAHVSELLTARCGRPLRFINAGTSQQTLAESWAIAEAIPDDRRKLVVVGMNYLRLEEGYDQTRRTLPIKTMPFDTPAPLMAALDKAGHPVALTFPSLKNVAWLLRQGRWRGELSPPSTLAEFVGAADRSQAYQGPHNAYKAPALSGDEKDRIVRHRIVERLTLFRAVHAEAAALWAEFTRRFDTAAGPVLYLALPESVAMAPLERLAGPAFDADMAKLRDSGALVADWRQGHGLDEADFHDQQHLLASGRARIEGRFVELLAVSTPGCRR